MNGCIKQFMVSINYCETERKKSNKLRQEEEEKERQKRKRRNEIVNKFWCTDSFNCSIVLHLQAHRALTMAENSIRKILQRGSVKDDGIALLVVVAVVVVFAAIMYTDWEIVNCTHKSDLLVAIDKTLKQCTLGWVQKNRTPRIGNSDFWGHFKKKIALGP